MELIPEAAVSLAAARGLGFAQKHSVGSTHLSLSFLTISCHWLIQLGD
jgi:hypothetical protein